MWGSYYGEHKEGQGITVQNEVEERVSQEVDFVLNATAKYWGL